MRFSAPSNDGPRPANGKLHHRNRLASMVAARTMQWHARSNVQPREQHESGKRRKNRAVDY
jgi:hypothetical protein